MIKRFLCLIIISLLLNGCYPPPGEVSPGGLKDPIFGKETGGLAHGQWKPALSVGDNYWMVEGRPIQAALKGAGYHCAKFGKNIQVDKQEEDRYAQVYFSCQ